MDTISMLLNFMVPLVGGAISICNYKRYKKTLSRPLLTSLPGVFTSLGLLGTFISICVTLDGYSLNNPLNIEELVGSLTPAFTTSIWGLVLALSITVWTKHVFASEEARKDEELGNVSPEAYIKEISLTVKDLLIEQNEQNVRSKEVNENIQRQSAVLKRFLEDFTAHINVFFRQLQGDIQSQARAMGREQLEKTSEIFTTITEKLSSATKDILVAQRHTVESMMEESNKEMQSMAKHIRESIDNISDKLNESLSNLGLEQSNRLNKIISSYDSLSKRLSEQNSSFASNLINKLQSEYERIQQHNIESLQQMSGLREAYEEVAEKLLEKSVEMNKQTTTNLQESLTVLVRDVTACISTQCEDLANSITRNVESLDKSYRFIEDRVAEIKQNYEQAAIAFGDAVALADRTNEKAESTLKVVNNSLKDVFETNKRIGKVIDILETRQDNIEQLTRQINSISSTIVELQKIESMFNELVNK